MADGGPASDKGGHELANRLIGSLGHRPFAPTTAQLDGIGAGELVPGAAPGALAHVIAGRYAGLLADHLFQGAASAEIVEAYFRICSCARQAFLSSLETSE